MKIWYDKNKLDIPLIKQMLRFWQFEDNEMEDYIPEIYWTDEEKKFGDKIIPTESDNTNIKKFELDYWGLSNLDIMKKLNELEPNKKNYRNN